MESSEFLVHCQTLLDDKKTFDVLKLLQDDNNYELLTNVGWELVSILCRNINKTGGETDREINKTDGETDGEIIKTDEETDGEINTDGETDGERLENTEKCLLELIQRCSTKEVMLGLSEHLASECSLRSFMITLKLCKQTLLLLQRRQSKYLVNICNQSISKMKYLLELSTDNSDPDNKDIDSHETTLKTLNSLFCCTLDFTNGLVSHIGRDKYADLENFLCEPMYGKLWMNYEIESCRKAVVNFIFNFLEISVQSNVFVIATVSNEKGIIIKIIDSTFMFTSFPDLIDHLNSVGKSKCNPTGVVIFFYLIFVQYFSLHEIPHVYSHNFLFLLLAPYISVALKTSDTSVSKITVDLLLYFLPKVEDESFNTGRLLMLKEIGIGFTNIMVWGDEQNLRKKSQDTFVIFLRKMEVNARYNLLRCIYDQSENPGLLGYLINHINTVVEKLDGCSNSSEVDIGELAVLFTQTIIGENNVLQESDRFMAALNFVRFWLIRDVRKKKKSGIWNKLKELNKNISVLNNCIDLSKREFEEQIKQTSNPCSNSKDGFNTELLLSLPGGEMFPDLSYDEKNDIANKAFLTLDMMSSVIARIDEIISVKVEDVAK